MWNWIIYLWSTFFSFSTSLNFDNILKIHYVSRYQEVFFYTIAELATSNKPALKYWYSELVEILTAARVDEKFCTKLMCQLNQSMEVGELLADVFSQYILTQRPKELNFEIPMHIIYPGQQMKLFIQKVQQYHKGGFSINLPHSHVNYVPCDDVIASLAGARWDIISKYCIIYIKHEPSTSLLMDWALAFILKMSTSQPTPNTIRNWSKQQ